jgi:hypothetical protein
MRSNLNAWREILARVFAGFAERHDVTPDWLINPETNRRLKLDVVYPEIGVAIRYAGLQAGHQPGRLSLEEESQQQTRDSARTQVCRQRGIALVQIDVLSGEPGPILQEMRMALSDASRRLAQSQRPLRHRSVVIEQLGQARGRLDELTRRVRHEADLHVFADLWQDRQFAATVPTDKPAAAKQTSATYATGMAIRHSTFGDGYVTAIRQDPTGQLITVLFEDGTQRTFAAHLVDDKMTPRL